MTLTTFNLVLGLVAFGISLYGWRRAKRTLAMTEELTNQYVRARAEREALVQAFAVQGQTATLTWEDDVTLRVHIVGEPHQPAPSTASIN